MRTKSGATAPRRYVGGLNRGRLKIFSPAKINLFLEILGKRPVPNGTVPKKLLPAFGEARLRRRDPEAKPKGVSSFGNSYHEIETIIQEIDLVDQLEITEKRQGIHIKSDSPILPVNKSNLAYRAAELLKRHYRIKQGVEIIIRKRIPVGAGLGGGSSNAAYTLKGLNRLWRLGLSNIELALLAAQLGADVPFFIYGGIALCKGRGEIVFPLEIPFRRKKSESPLRYLIVYPDIIISTKKIYQNLNNNLTKYPRDVTIIINKLFRFMWLRSSIERSAVLSELEKILFNRLEPTVLRLYPILRKIRTELNRLGLSRVLISGSGSCLFGPVGSRKEGKSLARKIQASGLGKVWLTQSRTSEVTG